MSVPERDSGSGRRRRRQWSAAEKRRIVAEADEPGASVSVVARRYDLNANMLFTWRRELVAPVEPTPDPAVAFVPAAIAGPDLATAEATCTTMGRMEIVLADGDRIIAGSDVDAEALARVVRVLSRR
jgi:transposase